MYQVLTIPSSKSLKELVQGTLYAGTELSQWNFPVLLMYAKWKIKKKVPFNKIN
jgi:hypothetical protein